VAIFGVVRYLLLPRTIAKRGIGGRTATIGNKDPVVEHKGLFSRSVVSRIYAPHLQGFRVLCKLTSSFSMCLAPGRTVANLWKSHRDAWKCDKTEQTRSATIQLPPDCRGLCRVGGMRLASGAFTCSADSRQGRQ